MSQFKNDLAGLGQSVGDFIRLVDSHNSPFGLDELAENSRIHVGRMREYIDRIEAHVDRLPVGGQTIQGALILPPGARTTGIISERPASDGD